MINYELRNTDPAQATLNEDGSASIRQGFTTGVVGVPDGYGMTSWNSIIVTIADYANKTFTQGQAEVLAAVNDFISNKYPST